MRIPLTLLLVILAVAQLAVGDYRRTRPGGPEWRPEHDPEIRELLRQRHETALEMSKMQEERFHAGVITALEAVEFSDLVTDTEVQLAETRAQVVAAIEKQLSGWSAAEKYEEARMLAGAAPRHGVVLAQYWKLDSEIELLRAKGRGSDPAVRLLLRQRMEKALDAYEGAKEMYQRGLVPLLPLLRIADRVAYSEAQLAEAPGQIVDAREKHLANCRQWEDWAETNFKAGQVARGEVSLACCWRLDGEIELSRAKGLPHDPGFKKLLTQRQEVASEVRQYLKEMLAVGAANALTALRGTDLLLDAEVQLAETPEQVVVARQNQVGHCRELEQDNERRFEAGRMPRFDALLARCWRQDAEVESLRAKRSLKKPR